MTPSTLPSSDAPPPEPPTEEPAADGAAADKAEDGAKADEKTEEPAAKSTEMPSVARAFALGWQMVQLYQDPTQSTQPQTLEEPEKRLPGLSELVPSRRTEVGVLEIEAGLHSLKEEFKAAEVDLPSTETLRERMKEPPVAGSKARLKGEVRGLHITTLGRLTAVDFRLGKTYGLGRALAETCRVDNLAELHKQLGEHRIAQLQEWLADLSSVLPAHAGRATVLSLEQWVEWAKSQDEATWEAGAKQAKRALARQSKLWRAVLSGEKKGADMLAILDYTKAADRLIQQVRTVAKHFLIRYRGVLLPLAFILAAAAIVAIFAENANATVVALAGAAAALGVSWKGIGSTLGSAGARLQKPLWSAELDQAIAEAITVLPQSEKVAIDAAALPPSGPTPAPAPAPAAVPTPAP